MTTNFLFISASFLVVIAGAWILFVGFRYFSLSDISERLSEFVEEELDEDFRPRRTVDIAPRDLSGSFYNRVFAPRLAALGQLFSRLTPAGVLNSIEHRLVIAGNPYGMGTRGFMGLQFISIVVGFVLALLVLSRGLARVNLLVSLLLILSSMLIPALWLMRAGRKRQNDVRKGLPDALDMLSVCASAGLGFDQSLQQVGEQWGTEVGSEFGRVVSELNMGLSRQESLRNMADRVEIIELSTFVSLIIQAEQLGMSIADTLHTQAEQMRMFRRFRAEEAIQKIPTKMLFPIAFLIFPSILVVVLGPAIPTLIQLFSGF
jgi:tight adherence protein C